MARAPLSAVLLALLLCATPIVNAVGNTPSWHPRGAKTARENASGASLSRESAEDMEAGEADEDPTDLPSAQPQAEAVKDDEEEAEEEPTSSAEQNEDNATEEEAGEEDASSAERHLLQDEETTAVDEVEAAEDADEGGDLPGDAMPLDDSPAKEQVDAITQRATAEDTGEDPVGPSDPELESEAKAATEEKLREEEEENNLPHGTPSWHPARVHKHDGADDELPEEEPTTAEEQGIADEAPAAEAAGATEEVGEVEDERKRFSRRMLMNAPANCPEDRFLLGEC